MPRIGSPSNPPPSKDLHPLDDAKIGKRFLGAGTFFPQEDPLITPYHLSKDGEVYLYNCDSIQWMKNIQEPFADLVFADPPFNIGHQYDVYKDKKTKQQYLEWTREWLMGCIRCLKPQGSIYVCSGAKYQADIRVLMDEVGFHWQSTIVWHYTFGPNQDSKYTPSWVAIHYATMSKNNWTWNQRPIRVPSARQLKYNDKRAKSTGKTPDNVWILDPAQYQDLFTNDQDFMIESRICGTFKERVGHPCQMPTAPIERCILASTNEGDLVLDPFLGSGTTAVVCQKLKRRCIGIELSRPYIHDYVLKRIQ